MRKCKICGVDEFNTRRIINSKKLGGLFCDKCYQRESNNNKVYDLPNYGEVTYNEDGKPICHICGKAYNKILTHAWQVHKICAREYKEKFGLDVIKGIMSEESTKIARQRAFENAEVVIEKNLILGGKRTRFVKGSKGRTKDKVSAQTLKRLIKQARSIKPKRK